ncbi:MAG: hypothetical protein ACM358_17725 [Gemmatimonadota bacterium]
MTHVERIPAPTASSITRRVDAAGWGLFFIWVGVALLGHLGWGLGLLGVGAITVGVQLVRKYFGLAVEPFWVVVGMLFVIGGAAEFADLQFNLLPVVLIIGGFALLTSALRGQA